MKSYWKNGGIAPRILDLGTIGGEWSASRPGYFTPRKKKLLGVPQSLSGLEQPIIQHCTTEPLPDLHSKNHNAEPVRDWYLIFKISAPILKFSNFCLLIAGFDPTYRRSLMYLDHCCVPSSRLVRTSSVVDLLKTKNSVSNFCYIYAVGSLFRLHPDIYSLLLFCSNEWRFLPHVFIRVVVSLTIVHLFVFRWVVSQEVNVLDTKCLSSC
jgi:hypothetical protein